MAVRQRWATGVVAVLALAVGGAGAAYIWKEVSTPAAEAQDGGLAGDASADAKAPRGKPKAGKRGGRPGKPRVARGPGAPGRIEPSAGGEKRAASDEAPGDEAETEEPAETFEPPFRGRGPAGPTYEAALASNKQEVTIGRGSGPDLTDAQLSSPMHDGAFVSECGAPESMKVTVKVAIRSGRAAGVTVATSPPNPDIAGCIDRYVRTFTWPSSPKQDSFVSTY